MELFHSLLTASASGDECHRLVISFVLIDRIIVETEYECSCKAGF